MALLGLKQELDSPATGAPNDCIIYHKKEQLYLSHSTLYFCGAHCAEVLGQDEVCTPSLPAEIYYFSKQRCIKKKKKEMF